MGTTADDSRGTRAGRGFISLARVTVSSCVEPSSNSIVFWILLANSYDWTLTTFWLAVPDTWRILNCCNSGLKRTRKNFPVTSLEIDPSMEYPPQTPICDLAGIKPGTSKTDILAEAFWEPPHKAKRLWSSDTRPIVVLNPCHDAVSTQPKNLEKSHKDIVTSTTQKVWLNIQKKTKFYNEATSTSFALWCIFSAWRLFLIARKYLQLFFCFKNPYRSSSSAMHVSKLLMLKVHLVWTSLVHATETSLFGLSRPSDTLRTAL